jgi:hypothetical protein
MHIVLALVLAFLANGCGCNSWGNYNLDEKSFKAETLKMVEQRTGIPLPAGSRGLNIFYKGAPMDPYFVAKVEIPQTSHEELFKHIEQVPNQEISVSGSVTAKLPWWMPSKETIQVERRFKLDGNYVHAVLCEENGRWILYLEWYTV